MQVGMHLRGKACIIGAGSSGIAACKALYERGIPFDCFECSDRVGGNWVFGNKNGMSSAYRSLHINTSRERMAYSDFPMPADYPDFPHHVLIARYFDAYVDHFGFRDTIRFNTTVEQVEEGADGRFLVRVRDAAAAAPRIEEYGAVLVANGHHWDPYWPEPAFPGSFAGLSLHAHHYIDPMPFADKRVIVLGMGNSAMDIAVECSHVAARVMLAARRGAHIVPKYLLGRPLDTFLTSPAWPLWLKERLGMVMYRLAVGDLRRYGLPVPSHRPTQAHPTISSDIFMRLGSGDITVKPNLRRLCGDGVEFTDGSLEAADAIIYCTGYKVSFPFFDPGFLSAPQNELPLYRRVFHPSLQGIFFIGLLQPLGAIMPLAEEQGRWVADYLAGEYALPSPAAMAADIAAEEAARKRRYVASPRHTMQVDFDEYLYALKKERRAGQARSKRPMALVQSKAAEVIANADLVSCRGFIKLHSKSFYLSSLLLPRSQRHAAWALYAFCRQADDSVDGENPGDGTVPAMESGHEALALRRIDGLRRRLGRVYGEQPEPGPAHAIDRAFRAVVAHSGLPSAVPARLLDGMEMDARETVYATWPELISYCFNVAGTVGLMMTYVMGHRMPPERRGEVYLRACDLGIAMQLTNIARDVAEDGCRQRVYLPDELLHRHGLSRNAVLELCSSQRTAPPSLRQAIAELLQRAAAHYEAARAGIPMLPPAAWLGIASAERIYRGIGERLAASDYDALRGRAYLSAWGKLWRIGAAWLFNLWPPRRRLPAHTTHGPDDDLLHRLCREVGVSD
jgi:phytoene/squalene synthetase/cation diffusion facilitator CzcD-associated flavoprotein CzcO